MSELRYFLPCGCSFKQLSESIKEYDGLPPIEVDYYNIPLTCTATWDLISSGRTRGIFQLESNLGRSYAKKLEPDNMDHLAALTSLMRPGCLSAMLEGKSMTNHFVDRKQGIEDVKYVHEKAEEYLKDTYGITTYQEQIIAMAKGMAGYTPEQANKLRKAIGKKSVKELYQLQESFIEGCVNNGISREIGTQVFEDMKASGRYIFNKSHAYEYGNITYLTAYMKTHFPLHFFCAYLKFVEDNDELRELLSEMSLFNIMIKTPSIYNLSSRFTIKDGYIQYGYGEVKAIGHTKAEKFIDNIIEKEKELNKAITEFTWYEFLIHITPITDTTTIYNLISSGLLDHLCMSRTKQIKEFQTLSNLTGKSELDWIRDRWQDYDNLTDLISGLLEAKESKVVKKQEVFINYLNEKRRPRVQSLYNSLCNPSNNMEDTTDSICDAETVMLGRAISKSKTADKERLGNLKCLEFCIGRGYNNLKIVAEVSDVDERVIKNGKNAGRKFANVKLRDTSGEIECTIFSNEWEELKTDMILGNVLMVSGKRNQDKTLKIENVQIL